MTVSELADKLTRWIRGKVLAAGCRGVVVGMSGGLDSSVAAVLCHRAFPDVVLGVAMPCHSHPGDEEHARLVASRFAIPIETVGLDDVFNVLLKILPGDSTDPSARQRADANLKPRLRMLTLYHIASRRRYLVVGSSNRDELAIGYFTKYGDGGVDIMPLGGLTKSQVRELAGYLDIPRLVIDKPPSAGLWAGQTDEEDMGLSYEELDRYLATGTASDGVRQKIAAMTAASRHKRRPPPVAGFK